MPPHPYFFSTMRSILARSKKAAPCSPCSQILFFAAFWTWCDLLLNEHRIITVSRLVYIFDRLLFQTRNSGIAYSIPKLARWSLYLEIGSFWLEFSRQCTEIYSAWSKERGFLHVSYTFDDELPDQILWSRGDSFCAIAKHSHLRNVLEMRFEPFGIVPRAQQLINLLGDMGSVPYVNILRSSQKILLKAWEVSF